MTPEIQQRIAQVRRGEVPDGYRLTKVGIFPAEWELGRLADVLHCEPRPVPKPDKPYWRVGVRSWAKGTFQARVDDPSKVDMEELYIVRENDLIVNITFAWEQAIALVKPEDDGMFVSHRFPTYVFDKGNVPCFYREFVSGHRFRYLLGMISPGGAGRNRVLDRKAFLNLPVPVPPLAEQRKIAAILSAQDRVIELQERLLTEKRRQKQYLTQQLLTGKQRLPGFSGAWNNLYLRDISAYSNIHATGKREKYVSVENMSSNYGTVIFAQKSTECVTGLSYRKGNILIGNIRPYLKKVWLADTDGVCSSDILVLQSRDIKPLYLYFLIARDEFFEYVMQNAKGTKMPRGDKKYIMEMPLRVPSDIDEQEAIAEILSTADREIDLLRRTLEQEQRRKKALSQLLLTGIVRATNA